MWAAIMALHSSWKGYLKLSLVSVPVRAFSAISAEEGEIHFHQLHDQCHNRIKYVKTCPIHGAVPPEEIVSGYEYSKGQFVIVEKKELDQLKGDTDRSVNIESIVPSGSIDPLYLTERSTYLVPDGRIGEKPYALMERCLMEQACVAIGRRLLNGKDEIVMIRPREKILVMTVLNSVAQVRESESIAPDLSKVSVSAAEIKLTKTLFDAYRQEQPNLAEYTNHYDSRVAELIDAKVKGKKVTMPIRKDEPDVINLLDALRKSVETVKSGSAKKKQAGAPSPTAHRKATTKPKSRTA